MVIWQPRRGGWQGWWRPWSHQDCSRFLLHRLHSPGHEWLRPGCRNVVTISPLVTRQPIIPHISLFIWELQADCSDHQNHIGHTPYRILPWHNMDITISVLLLIWLTSKWLSSGLFILLAGHTRLISPRDHVWRCQWSVWVWWLSWPGTPGSTPATFLPIWWGMMQTLTQLC